MGSDVLEFETKFFFTDACRVTSEGGEKVILSELEDLSVNHVIAYGILIEVPEYERIRWTVDARDQTGFMRGSLLLSWGIVTFFLLFFWSSNFQVTRSEYVADAAELSFSVGCCCNVFTGSAGSEKGGDGESA